jgi:hypothetical protein
MSAHLLPFRFVRIPGGRIFLFGALLPLLLLTLSGCTSEKEPPRPFATSLKATDVAGSERPVLENVGRIEVRARSLPKPAAPGEKPAPAAAPSSGSGDAQADAEAERIARELAEQLAKETPDDEPEGPTEIKDRPPERPGPAEDAGLVAADLKQLKDLSPVVAQCLRKFDFTGAVGVLEGVIPQLGTRTGKGRAEGSIGEVRAMEALFTKLLSTLKPGAEIEVGKDLWMKVQSADREGLSGKVGQASVKRKWAQVGADALLRLLDWDDQTVDDLHATALFAYAFDRPEQGETFLLRCAMADGSRTADLGRLVAERRGEAPGTALLPYKGMWITEQEKGYIDKGWEKYEGRWMSPDDVMKAKGYIFYDGRWVTKREHDALTRRARKLAEMAKKLQPKGLIDKPGADREQLDWSKRRKYAIKGGHYTIESNLTMDAVKDVAYIMEVLHYNFRKIFGVRKTPKFIVKIGKNKAEYDGYMGGGGLGKCGTNGEISTFYQPPNTTMVLMHEGTHQFVFKFAPSCPRHWHEAIATFFECSKFVVNPKTRTLDLKTGLLNKWRLGPIQAEIRNNTYTPLRDYLCGKVQGLRMYHQGWALAYYFVNAHKGKWAKRFFYYIEKHAGKGGLGRKKGAREPKQVLRFMKAMGIWNIDELEEDWKKFILALDIRKSEDFNSGHR